MGTKVYNLTAAAGTSLDASIRLYGHCGAPRVGGKLAHVLLSQSYKSLFGVQCVFVLNVSVTCDVQWLFSVL